MLVAFGGIWLSVRGHQNPYSPPSGSVLAVVFVLVAINIVWSAVALKRAGTGVSGPAERAKRTWLGLMLAAWILAYAFTAPLYHDRGTPPGLGTVPSQRTPADHRSARRGHRSSTPRLADREHALALAIVAAVAGFGGRSTRG